MSSVNNNGTIDLAQINAMLNQAISNAEGTEKSELQGEAVLEGENVVITMRNTQTGETVTKEMSIEEFKKLETPEAVADFIDGLVDELEEQIQTLKDAAKAIEDIPDDQKTDTGNSKELITADGKYNTSGVQKTLCDIYELMNLMQQIAQQQRNNAREIRYSELEAQVASIKTQADHQRKAAQYSMIVSACVCVAQVGMLAYSGVKTIKGLQATSLTGVGQDVQQSQADIQTLEASNRPENLNNNVEKFGSKVGDTTAIDNKINNQSVTEARANFTEASKNYNDAKVEQQELTAKQEAGPISEAEQERLDVLNGTGEGSVKSLETKMNSARNAYTAELDNVMESFDKEYAEKVSNTIEAEDKYIDNYSLKHPINNSTNKTAYKDAQSAQMKAGNERSYVKAKITQLKSEAGATDSIKKDLAAAKDGLANKKVVLQSNKMYQNALSMGTVGAQTMTQLSQIFGQIGQSVAHYVQATFESEATLDQANQKEFEQFRDETNSLFQQAQELVNSVKNLLAAVIQAEASSVEQIIRG